MASAALGAAVAAALAAPVRSVRPVGGGCISDAGRVELAGGRTVFAKAAAGLPEGLLDVEAAGLRWLGEVPGVRVPEVLAATPEVLVLEWIEPGPRTAATGEALGRGLAALHRAGAPGFGWHRDGFIGTVPQRNTPLAGDWCTFWADPPHRAPGGPGGGRRHAWTRGPARWWTGWPAACPSGPGRPSRRPGSTATCGAATCTSTGTGRRGWWTRRPTAGTGRSTWPCSTCSPRRPRPWRRPTTRSFPLAEGWRERLGLWQLEPLLTHAVMFGGGYGDSALGRAGAVQSLSASRATWAISKPKRRAPGEGTGHTM